MTDIISEEWLEDHSIPKRYMPTKCNYNTLYLVSDKDLSGESISTGIPDKALVKKGYEDNTISRVCLYPSIDSCLMSMDGDLKDKTLYVHNVENIKNVRQFKPTTTLVPSSSVTSEVWAYNNVKVNCMGTIHVNDKKDEQFEYSYGETNQYKDTLCSWDWKWEDDNNHEEVQPNNDTIKENSEQSWETYQDGFYTPDEITDMIDGEIDDTEILHGNTTIKEWFDYYTKRCKGEIGYDVTIESAWYNRIKIEKDPEKLKLLGWNPVLEFTSYNRKRSSERLVKNLKLQSSLSEAVSKVSIDDKGNLIYNKNIDFQLEFNKAHKLLLSYEKVDNIDGMKYELCKLWFINIKLEEKLQSIDKTNKKQLLDIRARVLNDFNKYIKYVSLKDSSFNFSEYIKTTDYDPDKIVIPHSTLSSLIDITKRLLQRV